MQLRFLHAVLFGSFATVLPATAQQWLSVASVLRDSAALTGAHDIQVRDGLAFVAGKGFTRRNLPRDDNIPYEAGKGGSLAIVDVRQPTAPQVLWFADTPLAYEDAETVLPLGRDRLLVGARALFLFDTSDPRQPRPLAAIEDRPRVDIINGFARRGDTVIAANKLGYLFAVNVTAADTLELLGSRETRASGELTSPHDADFSGDLLVIVSPEGFGGSGKPGRLGVYRVVDAQTGQVLSPEHWSLVGRLEHPQLAGANRVMTRGTLAFICCSLSVNTGRTDELRSNVSVIDLGDPSQPRLLASVAFPDPRGPNGLETAGTLVFASGGRTVQAIDATDPAQPREVARLTSAEAFPGGEDDAHDLVYAQRHLFVTAQTSHSLVVIRLSEELQRLATP